MKNLNTKGNRLIQVKNGVIGPVEPRPVAIRERSPEDYPDLPKVYLEVAEMWGPRFGGPPLCDQYVAVLKHLLTEEEAGIVRHLKGARAGKKAKEIAEAEHRTTEEVGHIMDVLADETGR
ncbi:MAG: hypothetical protein A2Y79_14270 [Deltaproteobacteria bacterium RBG_13_43_22]|nr:MAG: hypothetical protein A2Y79_14270 [Deltaproteobacteria bacterium RBG_13_43_22]